MRLSPFRRPKRKYKPHNKIEGIGGNQQMSEDEYYYEDDQYQYDDDGGNGEEETWETIVENKYATAKSIMDSSSNESIKGFEEVISEDQDKARWTFKALKMLCRTCQRSKRYDQMVTYFQRMIVFHYGDRTRNDVEKAINKFIDRCSLVPSEVMEKVYRAAIDFLSKDLRMYEKLWFSVSIKSITILLARKDFHEALSQLEPLRKWCNTGEQAAQRKATQLIQVYAIEIQIFSEWNDTVRLRELYALATHGMEHAIAPPRVMGVIKECGGKMFMRQGLWREAHEAFNQAFRSFDDAGDSRRIANLKYLVLTSMMSSSKIDPFASNETKSFQNDPEIQCMTDLIQSCQRSDIKAFEKVLKDKRNSQSIFDDPFLFSYLQPLVRRVRLQALAHYVRPYRRVMLAKLAELLNVSPLEAESLCASLILDDVVKGKIDQASGALLLDESEGRGSNGGDISRYDAIEDWCRGLQRQSEDAVARVFVR